MNEKTVFIYENAIGKLVFSLNSPFWISDIDGVSSIDIDVSESRSNLQVGSSIAGQSIRPRTFTVDGAIFDPLDINRKSLISTVAPQVKSTFTVIDGNESWYLDVVPKRTPDVMPGNGVQPFQMQLHAAYPYWRTTKSYATQIAGLIPLFSFPFYTGGSWWLSRFSDSYYSTIQNHGNVPVEFQVTFTARSALASPELYHVDTLKKIRIDKEMTAGEKIVVSTVYGSQGVTCISASGEQTNAFMYLSMDSDLSMNLVPGLNLLRIGAETNREGLGVRIEAPEGVKSGV